MKRPKQKTALPRFVHISKLFSVHDLVKENYVVDVT